mgnify:CR=1 FL=1
MLFSEPGSAFLVLFSAVPHDPSVHCTSRLANPMSLPPIVTVTMFVPELTAEIWLAMRLVVVAPEQATKFSDVFGRCCETRYG